MSTWPTAPIDTSGMDNPTDVPPRAAFLALAQAVNQMVASPPDPGDGRLLSVVASLVGPSSVPVPADASFVVIDLYGAGGAGGGANATAGGQRRMGAGGGGGAFLRIKAPVDATAHASIAVVVGSGGLGDLGVVGEDGDPTTVAYGAGAAAWSASAGGGFGGAVSASFADASPVILPGAQGGQVQATGLAAVLDSVHGAWGGDAVSIAAGACSAGTGASALGQGGRGASVASSASALVHGGSAVGYSAGGGGGVSTGGANSAKGGDGRHGRAIIYFYS